MKKKGKGMKKRSQRALVIFGATGDLARRKLFFHYTHYTPQETSMTRAL